MHNLVNYIVESSVTLAVFALFYLLVLQNITNLKFKRCFLIVALVFTAIIPLLNFSFSGANANVQTTTNAYYLLETVTVTAGEITEITVPVVSTHQWIVWFYATGLFLLLLRLGMGLVRIGWMRNLFSSTKTDGYRLFITDGKYHPFSFFRWVFIPTTLWEDEMGNIILQHEKEHSRQWHSVDILILEMILMVQWFNPFAWIIRKAMKNNHEFMADRAVLNNGIKQSDYLSSMLFQTVGARFEMGNNFSLSITKKRVKMMKSDNNKIKTGWLIGATSAIMLTLLLVFACNTQELVDNYINPQTAFVLNGRLVLPEEVLSTKGDEIDEKIVKVNIDGQEHFLKPDLVNDLEYAKVLTLTEAQNMYQTMEFPAGITQVVSIKQSATNKQVFMVVEQMPSFPGGDDSLLQYLSKSIVYPQKAYEANIQGRVYVSFIVGKDGTISDVVARRKVDPLLDDEAVRVVQAMPKWTPGYQRGKAVNVKYMLPINFVLNGSYKDSKNKMVRAYIKDGSISIDGVSNKVFSVTEAASYIVKMADDSAMFRFKIFAQNNTATAKQILAKIESLSSSRYAINNIQNNAQFQINAKSLEELNQHKEAIRALNKTNVDLKINIKPTKDTNNDYVLSFGVVAKTETLQQNKAYEKYVKNEGGTIVFVYNRELKQI